MTKSEKMFVGQFYDCADPELLAQWHRVFTQNVGLSAHAYIQRTNWQRRPSFGFFDRYRATRAMQRLTMLYVGEMPFFV